MQSKEYRATLIALVLLLILACRSGPSTKEVVGPTAAPAEASVTPVLALTPTAFAATQTPQPDPVPVRRERLGQAGLVYEPPTGYEVDHSWQRVSLRPAGAGPSAGTLIEIDSNPFLCGERVPDDVSAALEAAILCASWRFDILDAVHGDPVAISVGGHPALMSEIRGDRDGAPVRMQIYVSKPGPTRVLTIIGLVPEERQADGLHTLEELVASVELLTWQSFTNGNDVADLAFFDGYLWTATGGGVVAWPLGLGILPVKYTTGDGLPGNAARALTVCPVMGEPTLFAGTQDGGVARFDPGRWRWLALDSPYAEWTDRHVRALDCALDNRLVVGYEDQGVDFLNLDETDWYHFSPLEGVPIELRDLSVGPDAVQVWVIGEDRLALISDIGLSPEMGDEHGDIFYQAGSDGAGNLWLAGFYRVARRSATGEWRYFDNPEVANLFDTSVTALAVAADDTLWIGSYNQVARFDPSRAEVFDLHRDEPGMVAGLVRRLAVDPVTGWVAYGTSSGASVLKDGEWLSFVLDQEPLVDNEIRTITQDIEGRIWYGDRLGGLVFADHSAVASPEGRFELPRGFALSIYPDPYGGIWIGHFDGASHYTPQGELHLAAQVPELADQYVRAIARDSGGRLWLGSDEGLFIWDDEQLIVLTDADGLPSSEVRALQPDGEAMWAGTMEGLVRLVGETVEVFNSRNSALPSDVIGALALDPWGDLLVAAGSELLIRQAVAGAFQPFLQTYTESPLTSIGVGAGGEIWATTARDGVYGLLFQGEAAEWQHLSAQDGPPGNTYGPHAVLVDRDGVVWLGGASGGLGRYGP